MFIVWVNTLLIVVIAVAHWRLPDVVQPTLPFGVRAPAEHGAGPTVRRLRRQYRAILIPLALAAIAAAWGLRSAASPATALPTVGLLLLLYLDYYLAHRQLAGAKRRQGWYAGRRQAVVATVDRVRPSMRPPLWPLAAAALILAATAAVGILRYPLLPAHLPVHFGLSGRPDRFAPKSVGSAFAGLWIEIGMTALLTAAAFAMGGARQELDPADPEASAARHVRFLDAMARILMILMLLLDLTLSLASLRRWGIVAAGGSGLGSALVQVPVLLGVVYAIRSSLRIGQGGSRLSEPGGSKTDYVHRDDDRFWKGGALYVNRNDAAIVVQRRFGVGWTLNFGRPGAWLLLAALAALALLPVLRRVL